MDDLHLGTGHARPTDLFAWPSETQTTLSMRAKKRRSNASKEPDAKTLGGPAVRNRNDGNP